VSCLGTTRLPTLTAVPHYAGKGLSTAIAVTIIMMYLTKRIQ
jgi:hypothetical protein